MRKSVQRGLAYGILAVTIAILLAAAGALWWALTPLGPSDVALAALESDDAIVVSVTGTEYAMQPAGDNAHVGVILYPGGRVDYRSYAPLAREIASLGYLVVVPRVTLNLAVLDANRADEVVARHPDVLAWAIGGHSLGGAMAASYAEQHPDTIDALVLLAAYPASSTDLSDRTLPTISIFGTRDGVLSNDSLDESAELLPSSAVFVPVEGGNHAQFGSYGPQPGDKPASITAEDQQWETATQIAMLLRPLRLRTLGQ